MHRRAECAKIGAMTTSEEHPPRGFRLHAPWIAPQLIAWLLWTALLVSYAIYGLTAYFMLADGGAPSGTPVEPMAFILACVSFGESALAYGISRVLPRWLFRKRKLERTAVAGWLLFLFWFVALWLIHAIGVYGLVLFFISHSVGWLAFFMVPSVAGTIALAPRWNDLRALALERSTRPDGSSGP